MTEQTIERVIESVLEERVSIKAVAGRIDTWLFQPEIRGSWPAIILHTDIKGVRETFIAMGRKLAAHGFIVLLPNLYYRDSPAPVIAADASLRDEQYKERFNQLRAAISVDGLRSDHQTLIAYLKNLPNVKSDKFGIVGYCMSGAIALRAAADFPDNIVAAASFHGGRLASDALDSPHLRAADIRARVYLGYAQEDASMTDEMIAKLEFAFEQAQVKCTSEHYPARHGFAVADSPAYDVAAAEHHWQSLLNLFNSVLYKTL